MSDPDGFSAPDVKEAMNAYFADLHRALGDVAAAAARIPADLARAARAESRGEPADPRERALWLRRNRNTGPAPRGRRR